MKRFISLCLLSFSTQAMDKPKSDENPFQVPTSSPIPIVSPHDFESDDLAAALQQIAIMENDEEFARQMQNDERIAHEMQFQFDNEIAHDLAGPSVKHKEDELTNLGIVIDSRLIGAIENPGIQQKLKELDLFLKKIPKGNAHFLDGTAKGDSEMLNTIGAWLSLDNPDLSFAQIAIEMNALLTYHTSPSTPTDTFVRIPEPFLTLREDVDVKFQPLPPSTIASRINTFFNSQPQTQQMRVMCPLAEKIWSRNWTLARRMATEDMNFFGVTTLFGRIMEDQTTGGCPQGRINRGLWAYAQILNYLNIRMQ